jgi:hypothetical protein
MKMRLTMKASVTTALSEYWGAGKRMSNEMSTVPTAEGVTASTHTLSGLIPRVSESPAIKAGK